MSASHGSGEAPFHFFLTHILETNGVLGFWGIVRGSNDAQSFKAFISELVRNTKGEAYIYMDNYSVHHSKEVREFFNQRI